MTLLDAKEYDPEKERRKRVRIISAIAILLLAGFFLWWFRYWPEQRVAEHFFDALQKRDYESAYAI